MIIAVEYPFNNGDSIKDTHPYQLQDVENIINSVDALHCKTKTSKEITMPGKQLYSPRDLNIAFAQGFESKGWQKKRRIDCHCHVQQTITVQQGGYSIQTYAAETSV